MPTFSLRLNSSVENSMDWIGLSKTGEYRLEEGTVTIFVEVFVDENGARYEIAEVVENHKVIRRFTTCEDVIIYDSDDELDG